MRKAIENAKAKARAKANEIYGQVQERISRHTGASRDSSITRNEVSMGDSTLPGPHCTDSSASQSQAVPSERPDASHGPTDTTTAKFESPSVAQVLIPPPGDRPNPAIAVMPTHTPDKPLATPPGSPGVPSAGSSTSSTLNNPDSLSKPPTLPLAPTAIVNTLGGAPGDTPGDAPGDMPEGIPGPSAPPGPLAVLSVPSISLPENLASGTSAKASDLSLWGKAFEKLSVDKKAILLPNTNKALEACIEDIVKATEESRDICLGEKKKFTVWGKTIIVRDVADKILAWVEKFKDIGDCASQYDPVHTALPWAAVRFLLQIALQQKETMEAVLIGVERIARSLVRCDLYKMLYLEPGLELSVCRSLEAALEEFYLAVLEFLVFAKRYFDKSSPRRMFQGLLEADGKSNFSRIEEKEARVLEEVQAAEVELRKRDHNDLEHKILPTIEDRHKKLRIILKAMEMPITRIDLTVGKIHDTIQRDIDRNKRNDILKWVSQVEYEMHHRNARENLLSNTGQWLFEREEFREWRTSSSSGILWLHGIPGAGKTKLVCATIDFLESTGQTHEPVIYFYCNQNENPRRDPTIIMQAFVQQLSVVLLPRLPSQVTAIYNAREERGFAAGPLEFKESCGLLHSLLDLYAHTTIVIDALDEADRGKRGELLEALKTIISSSNSLVKIFISSRDDVDIKLELEEVPNLYIRAADNEGDINRFIRREVEASIKNRGILWGSVTNELKELIISTVANKADGMFQWAALQVTHLCKMKLVQDIESGLGKLPKTLEDAYAQTWEDALLEEPYAQRLREKALMWVMCALSPLSEELWANASYWPDAVPDGGVLTLFELCRNLVTLDTGRWRVVFAHLSVSEYLEAKVFTSIDAHSMAVESCLSFFDDAHNVSVYSETLLHNRWSDSGSFSTYSFSYWEQHCQYLFDEGKMSEVTKNVLRRFLGTPTNPGQGYSQFLKLTMDQYSCSKSQDYTSSRSDDEGGMGWDVRCLSSRPINPLFALSYFSFMTELKELWEFKGVDINCKNEWGQSLLFVAVMHDNVWAMDILLAKGAQIDMGNRRNMNLLLDAVMRRKVGAAIFLTGYGGIQVTPRGLIAAIEGMDYSYTNRRIKIVEMLIDKCTGTEITPAVLIATTQNGNNAPSIAEMLLTKNTSIEITTEILTALARKSNAGSVARVFLKRCTGAEITTAVLIAAIEKPLAYNDYELVNVLLTKCPVTEITTEVLIAAAKGDDGTSRIMQALLAKCDCIQITEAVLIAAMENRGHRASYLYPTQIEPEYTVTEILLEKSINTKITEALLIAATGMKSSKVLESLLIRDADATVTEAVLLGAAKNFDHGGEMFDLFFARHVGIKITAAVLIAVIQAYWSNYNVLKFLFAECADSELTEAVLMAVVSCASACDTMDLLLDRYASCHITEAVVVGAATNMSCGYKITKMLTTRFAEIKITNAVLLAVAHSQDHRSNRILEMLLEDFNPDISEELVIAVARKNEYGDKTLQLLCTKCVDTLITEKVLMAVMQRWRVSIETMQILLEKCADSQVTEKARAAAIWGGYGGAEVVRVLLDSYADTQITEKFLIAAAQGGGDCHQVMEILLTKCADTLITEEVLITAAQNQQHGHQIMEILLEKCADTLITEEVLISAAQNDSKGHQVMEILLTKCADTLITEEVLITAAQKKSYADEIMEVLLSKCASSNVTEQVLVTACTNYNYSHNILSMLLAKCDNTQATEMAMVSAAGGASGERVQEVLWPRASEILITESVLVAAVRCGSLRNAKLLLPKYADIPITEAVLVAAIDSYKGCRVLEYFLSRGYDIPITEAIVAAAARAKEAMMILSLLILIYGEIPITEAVVTAAAGTMAVVSSKSVNILEFLFSRHPDIPITEAVVVAAAGRSCPVEVLKFLFSRDPDIPITEAVVVAAAQSGYGEELPLLSRYSDIPVTEAVIVAAAGSRYGVGSLRWLLSRHPDIQITKEVIVAAVGGSRGEEVLQLLLPKCSDIPITEVVVAAAGCEWGDRILQFLLSKYPYIQITEEVIVAALGSERSEKVLQFLLSRHPDIPITEAVWVAAVGNQKPMQLMGLLEASVTSITITSKIKQAAARNSRFNNRIMKFLHANEAKPQSSLSPPMLKSSEDIDDAEYPTEEALGAA